MTPCLIAVSLATSGLTPHDCLPLELGAIAIDRKTLEPVTFFNRLWLCDPTPALEQADDFVADLHGSNGLFETLVTLMPDKPKGFRDFANQVVDPEFAEFIDEHGAGGELGSPLIAFGTSWTLRWLELWLPRSARKFKGSIDLTTVLGAAGKSRPKTNGRADEALAVMTETFQKVAKSLR